MKLEIRPFYHPKISLPVVRRRASDLMLDMFCDYMDFVSSRGWSLLFPSRYESTTRYHSAVCRLQKVGLIAKLNRKTWNHELQLTEAGVAKTSAKLKPEKFWKQKWNGHWFLLSYDIPEKERKYRDTFRKFVKEIGMGCLQHSLYITARDIRPEYEDLCVAAGIGAYAVLLDAQTVLNQKDSDIVQLAWDFDNIEDVQGVYLDVYEHNLSIVESGTLSRMELMELAKAESKAYLSSMELDPLLPEDILPKGYKGKKVFELHKRMVNATGEALREV